MVIPPVLIIAERRVAAHLRQYGAIKPEKAMGFAPARHGHARALAHLRDAEVVKGSGGSLWLDEEAWTARRDKRRKRAFAILAAGVVGAAIAGVTTLRG